MATVLTDEQVEALVNCLGEAIGGLGIADDADELVAYQLKDQGESQARAWASQWDIAIAFHNAHCDSSYKDPWVVKELNSLLEEV